MDSPKVLSCPGELGEETSGSIESAVEVGWNVEREDDITRPLGRCTSVRGRDEGRVGEMKGGEQGKERARLKKEKGDFDLERGGWGGGAEDMVI